MAEVSQISWCDSTFNPWVGCEKVSPACDGCYAEAWSKRAGRAGLWEGERARTKTWNEPAKWDDHAQFFQQVHGRRQRVFTASLADFFDNAVPVQWRIDAWQVLRGTPNLDWYVVTKRIPNVKKMLPADWSEENYRHVVLIITVVTQAEADRDIPRLLDLKREFPWLRVGLSIEPMLERISLEKFSARACTTCGFTGEVGDGPFLDEDQNSYNCPDCHGLGEDEGNHGLDWVIVGGESGGAARPIAYPWVREIRDWCAQEKVPFHFKQHGEWAPASFSGTYFYPIEGWPQFAPQAASKRTHDFGGGIGAVRIGKAKTGRTIDGATHDGFPRLEAA